MVGTEARIQRATVQIIVYYVTRGIRNERRPQPVGGQVRRGSG